MQHDNTHGASRRKLSDILNGGSDSLRDKWNQTEAASDFAPLPAGNYTTRVVSGELFTAKTGTPGYKLTFRVLEGDYAGRLFWHDVWLTPTALPMAKRDLGKLGVADVDQLEQPLPASIRCTCKVALRRDDDGTEYNRVRHFEVIGIDDDPMTDDAFAPGDGGDGRGDGDSDGAATAETEADADKATAARGQANLIDATADGGKVGLPDA